jgi:uncharacterized protein (DUF2132 family)
MNEVQKNNPLHGVKLESLLTDLVDYYGWEALAADLNMNCFKSNPSIKSSLKFLRKTPWAREKVESFYLYRFKGLPRPNDEQYALPPRDRTIPLDQQPAAPRNIIPKSSETSDKDEKPEDVWDNWKKKNESE